MVMKNYFSYFSTKTYVVGTQKNRLNETVLLRNQNICFNLWVRKNAILRSSYFLIWSNECLCLNKLRDFYAGRISVCLHPHLN